jgi:hypothetical protein
MEEWLIDEAWLRKKPKWESCFGLPTSFAMVWKRFLAVVQVDRNFGWIC